MGVGALAVVLLALQPFFASPRRAGLPPPQAGEVIGVAGTPTPAVAAPSRTFSPAPVSLSTRMASPTHRPSPRAKPRPTATPTPRPTARPSTAPASSAPPPPPPPTTQPPTPGPGELSPLPPSQEPSLRSSGGGPETFVDFVNARSQPVVVYWLDYDGRRQPYASLQPGESHRQQTYVGHPWVVTDAGGVGLACFLPAPEIARAVAR
ncbi:VHL beta domain-containing protein [Micromonospora siamensis]|uniref:VHL beta domain-containing protein n=1 Tax=Micromonospora siamensis TaxID=299152 RepID=UPI00367062FB